MEILRGIDPRLSKRLSRSLVIPLAFLGQSFITPAYAGAQTEEMCTATIEIYRPGFQGRETLTNRTDIPINCDGPSTLLLNPNKKGSAR